MNRAVDTTLTIPRWLSDDITKLAAIRSEKERRVVRKNEVIIKLVTTELKRNK